MLEGLDVRDRRHTEFGIEVLREPKIGEDRVGRGGSDDEETAALKSGLSYLVPTTTILLPSVVYDRRGLKGPVEQSWRTWARLVSNLERCWYSVSRVRNVIVTEQSLQIVHDDDTQRTLITIRKHLVDGGNFLSF